MFQVGWDVIKNFVTQRNLSIQFFEIANGYHLVAADGIIAIWCILNENRPDEIADFEANFKASGNQKAEQRVTIIDPSAV